MENLQRIFVFALLLVLSLVVAGCAPALPQVAPTPAPPTVPPPTVTQAAPTSTPLPAPTPGGPVSLVWKITGDPEPFTSPSGLALDKQGNLYVFDVGNTRVYKYNRDGALLMSWGSRGTGDGQFAFVTGTITVGNLAVDGLGNVYVADPGNVRVQKFDAVGKFVMAFGSEGKGDGQFSYPQSVAVDSLNYVYVVDGQQDRIQKFDSNGKFLAQFGSAGSGEGQFVSPGFVSTDDKNNIYVTDMLGGRIEKFNSDGKFLAQWENCGTSSFYQPTQVAVDKQGNMYIAEYSDLKTPSPGAKPTGNRVCKLDAEGHFITAWGGRGNGDGQFVRPAGIVVDDNGSVYVSETANHRVQKFRQQ